MLLSKMLVLGSDIGYLCLLHLHGYWTSKTWWNRNWRKTRTNAKWSIANVNWLVHPSVYRSSIFLLHGFAQSKKRSRGVESCKKMHLRFQPMQSLLDLLRIFQNPICLQTLCPWFHYHRQMLECFSNFLFLSHTNN